MKANVQYGEIVEPWIRLHCYKTQSFVRVMRGASMVALYLRIMALTQEVILEHFELSRPDWPVDPYILDDPSVLNPACAYRLLDGSDFHRDDVLNHRIGTEGTIRHRRVMSGFLLAQSFTSEVPELPDRERMSLVLAITNQFDQVQVTSLDLPVQHIPFRFRPRAVGRRSLFDDEDSSGENVSNVIQMPRRP